MALLRFTALIIIGQFLKTNSQSSNERCRGSSQHSPRGLDKAGQLSVPTKEIGNTQRVLLIHSDILFSNVPKALEAAHSGFSQRHGDSHTFWKVLYADAYPETQKTKIRYFNIREQLSKRPTRLLSVPRHCRSFRHVHREQHCPSSHSYRTQKNQR